jgi:cysteine desulfurase
MNAVYLDHAAAGPVDDRVLAAMLPFFREQYGNPQTIYAQGAEAREALDTSRQQVADLIGARRDEITFTSCGTEGNNLALKGLVPPLGARGRHIIVSAIEHVSVLTPARALARQGCTLTELPVDRHGLVDPAELERSIRPDTVLVSIAAANDEVGTIQPLAELGRICRERKVLFHTNAVAAAGAMPLDVDSQNVDALTLAGATLLGPKGSGALYVRSGLRLVPQIEGGGQENGRRAGTENMPALVGLGRAAELARLELDVRRRHLLPLRDRLLNELPSRIPRTHVTGHPTQRLPGHASVCVEFIEGEAMLLMLDDAGIAVASGSACTSRTLKASHVLLAMGIDHALAQGSLMLTLGPTSSVLDVDCLLERLPPVVERLRALSPLYAKFRKDPAGYDARQVGDMECTANE